MSSIAKTDFIECVHKINKIIKELNIDQRTGVNLLLNN